MTLPFLSGIGGKTKYWDLLTVVSIPSFASRVEKSGGGNFSWTTVGLRSLNPVSRRCIKKMGSFDLSDLYPFSQEILDLIASQQRTSDGKL